jgi:hypothetical protein
MLDFVVVAAAALALVSFFTSCVAIFIQYAKRDDNPVIAPLQTQIDALRLAHTDLIDRVDQWTKRDRTRRLRAAEVEPQEPETLDKNQLRALAAQARGRP